ncbi:hypothetical protein DFS34DRAFT_328787 [Phlyctochytrium arcticum]|nr:hypothetical protein DFS34DRAFT_328787 [Phlyctochytrium arcticum]
MQHQIGECFLFQQTTIAGVSTGQQPSNGLLEIPESGMQLPAFYDTLLKAIVEVGQKKLYDLNFYAFDGTGGMVFPGPDKWPINGGGGWSFATWVWLDEEPWTSVADQSESTTVQASASGLRTIFGLWMKNGEGSVEIGVINNVLTVLVTRGGNVHTAAVESYVLGTGQWHCIALSHANPKLPWSSTGELTAYINGESRFKGKLEYPESGVYSSARIGCSNKGNSSTRASTVTYAPPTTYSNSFAGQLTSIYLLDDNLNGAQASTINAMGPFRISQFRKRATTANPSSSATLSRTMDATFATLSSFPSSWSMSQSQLWNPPPQAGPPLDVGKIVMQFHPMATRGMEVRNRTGGPLQSGLKKLRLQSDSSTLSPSTPQSVQGDPSDYGTSANSDKMMGVVTCATKCFRTGVHALGGVDILIPLLAQVDLQTQELVTANELDGTQGDPEELAKLKRSRIKLFFDMLAMVLIADIQHQDRFATIGGPKLISALLRQNHALGLGIDILYSIVNLRSLVMAHSQLPFDIAQQLIFEPRIWTRTPPAIQMEYFHYALTFLENNPEVYREKFGASFWIEALERYYRYTAQPSALIPAADASGVVGPESARSSSSPQDSFKLLRRFIIGIIKRLLLRTSSSAINSDIDNLIQVLACSDDSTHVAELLTLILEISIHNPETKFLERFLGQSGAEVLVLILVNRKLERTRILALQIIFMVIISPHVSDRWKKRMKLDDISWLGTSLGGGSASSTSAPGASVLARLLREHPLTTKTYYALLQMALEEQILDWELQEALVVPLEMKGAKIRNRGYLQALLELAANTAGDVPDITKLKSEVVRDLLVIGCRNGNAEVIHKMPRWQGALLDLLESKKSPRLSSVVPPPSVLEPSTQPEEIRKHTNVSLEPLSEELESLEETGDETAAEERDECLSDNQTVTSSTDDQREEPSSSSDVPDVPEIQESPDASAPAASETPSEDLNVLPTQLSDLAGVQPPEDDVRASQTVSLADDTTRLINLVFETLITFTLDTFDSDKKAWRSVEEVAVCAWFLRKGDEAYQLLKTFLLRLMGAIKGEVAGGDWRNFSGARVENIAHTLLFVEEFMFNHHDLRDALMRDVRQEDPRRLAFLPTLTGLLAAPSGAGGQVIRMSFPVGECRDLVEETLDVLSLLIDVGVTHISISDTAEKSHTRSGGLIRLAIRLLLSALTVPEDAVWNLALRHLIPILDKHAMTFSENRPKERGFYILAHIHSIFSVAQARALKAKDVLRPDYRILIPLYMLVVTRWRDSVNSISSTTSDAGDGVIFSDKLLNEALADQQIFLHMITSPVWSGAFDSYFWPTMKAVEEEDFAMVPLATRRFARTVHATHVRWAKEEAAMDKCREHVCGQLDRVARKRREDEATHCAEREKDEELDKRAVTRQTCFLWRTLTQERGIWSIVDAVGDSYGDDVRWKLDRAENHLRMRKRLAPNWEFDDHANAAAKRDRTFKPDVANTGSLSRTASSNAIAMTAADRKSQMDRLKMQVESGMGVAPGLLKEISLLSLGVSPGEDATELGDEEWSVLNEDDLQSSSQAANSTTLSRSGPRVLYAEDCELILLMTAVKGRLELTPTHLTFTADIKATTANLAEADREAVMVLLVDNDALLKERRWALQDLYDCYLRRYMLRKSAVELFFTDKTNYLFNFLGPSKVANKERLRFVKYLINCKPSQLNAVDLRSNPIEIVKKMGVTDMWARREISNFEYLMWLNTVSGRTYNDLTQYPVFPWVITDYTSPKLDLKDPSIYRDLSKPIGALDERRLEQFAERYSAFEDPNGQIKKFHYGTHYSSAAATLFYLLRVEPYTTLHIALQAGKFDHPDRQFHSMQSCWNSVLKGNGDVKELIPEFYYMPEFLCNENKFDLGTKQTGERLDNVILPPWAETAEDFVRIHREALESDHVSENLHQWIDLIWGYKQTGEEAVKAFNVFYYLTYEGAINIDAIKDPIERRSIEDQINNFGQTPSQLFKKPHPRRQPRNPDRTTLFDAPDDHRSYLIETKGTEIQFNWACVDDLVDANGLTGTDRVPHGLHHGSRSVSSPALPAWTGFEGKRVITVDGDMCFRAHKWNGGAEIPFTFETDNTALRKRKIPFQLASTTHPHSQLFSATHDGRFLIAGGCWDASLHVLHLEGHHGHGSPRIVDVVTGHRDIVTCIAIGEDDKTVVSGSMDTTVIAWELDAGTGIIRKNGGEVFCGHDDWVTAVAVNVEHGLVVSGSKDGTVILHVLQGAKYLRTLRPAAPSQQTEILSIHRILITTSATIIIHTESSVPPTSTTSSSSTASPTSEQQAGSTSLATTDSTTTTTTTTTQLGYLHAYTLNGKWIQSRLFTTRLNDVKASRDGKDLVAVDSRGGIVLMKTHNLHITHRFDVSIGILSVSISTDQRYLFLGRVDGTLLVIAHEPR